MIKLNLGAGEFPMKGFVNIDAYPGKGIDKVCNIINLPYEDNSIEEIYAGHVIEHLFIDDARKALKEALRVLKPGSRIGIVIPDKNKTPLAYIKNRNHKKKHKNHNSFWNLKMLKEEAEKAGFVSIEEMNIDTYPHLVARPHWQSGITAEKGGNLKMKETMKPNSIKEKLEKAKKEGIRRMDLSSEEREKIEKEKDFIPLRVYQADQECKKNEFGKYFEIKLIEK